MWKCESCKTEFSRKWTLKRHISDNKKCKSQICENSFGCVKKKSTKGKKKHTKRKIKLHIKVDESDSEVSANSGDEFAETTPDLPNTANPAKVDYASNSCVYCHRLFSSKYTLTRHIINVCKMKRTYDTEKEELLQSLISELRSQKQTINELKKENKLIRQNNKHIRRKHDTISKKISKISDKPIENHNIHMPVKLVPFGNENLDTIPNDICAKILDRGYNSVPALVKKTHFDATNPKYHNVYISNLQNDFVMVYNGSCWTVRPKEAVLDQIKSDKESHLVEKFEELLPTLPERTVDKFKRFLNDNSSSRTDRYVKKQIKMILYNNRSLPERLKKQMCKGIEEKLKGKRKK
jgi:hypothetical protein